MFPFVGCQTGVIGCKPSSHICFHSFKVHCIASALGEPGINNVGDWQVSRGSFTIHAMPHFDGTGQDGNSVVRASKTVEDTQNLMLVAWGVTGMPRERTYNCGSLQSGGKQSREI